jgi:hypothetical protein
MINVYLQQTQVFDAQAEALGFTFLNESYLNFKRFELVVYLVALVMMIRSYVSFSEEFPGQMVRYSWTFTGLAVIGIIFFYNTPVSVLGGETYDDAMAVLVLDVIYDVALSAFWMWFFNKPEVIEQFSEVE